MLTPVRISDIGLYLRCPRLVYFDALGSLPRKVRPVHLLLRELMLGIFCIDNLEGELEASLAKLEQDLPLIFGDEIDPEELGMATREVVAMIPGIAQGLATVLDKILPSDLEVDLRSDRLGLSGRRDRLVTNGHVPSIIKTGFAPDDGVWKKDRLQLAGGAGSLNSLLHRAKMGAADTSRHRLLAAERVGNAGPAVSFPSPLRVTAFPAEKSRRLDQSACEEPT